MNLLYTISSVHMVFGWQGQRKGSAERESAAGITHLLHPLGRIARLCIVLRTRQIRELIISAPVQSCQCRYIMCSATSQVTALQEEM